MNCMAKAACLLLSMLCCAGLPAQVNPAGTAPAPKPAAMKAPTIAVVDIVKAVDNYPRAIRGKKQLQESGQDAQRRLAAEAKKIEDLRLHRDTFNPGSRDRALCDNEINSLMKRFDGLQKVLEADLEILNQEYLVDIYERVERAIATAAKERGVDLVLRLHPMEVSGGDKARDEDRQRLDRLRVFERRQVWFAGDEIDLTPTVIKVLLAELPDPARPADGPVPGGESKDGSARPPVPAPSAGPPAGGRS